VRELFSGVYAEDETLSGEYKVDPRLFDLRTEQGDLHRCCEGFLFSDEVWFNIGDCMFKKACNHCHILDDALYYTAKKRIKIC
jgi:hypothetical protein